MNDIAIIKSMDILLEQIVKILEENLPDEKITCYEPDEYSIFYQHQKQPDLMIVDMDTYSREELFQFVKFCSKQKMKTIIWTSFNIDDDYLTQLFKLSLDGYFYNEMRSNELILAIRGILNGRQYIHPYLSSILLRDYVRLTCEEPQRPSGLLTEREWEILELIVEGRNTNSISEKLFISSKTVTNHITSILQKLNVEDRTNAALLAIRKKWIVL